jgi:hypothetical protein
MDIVICLEYYKDKLAKKIQEELLLLGSDGPERLSLIESLFDKMKEIDKSIDKTYEDYNLKREYIKFSGYEHLDGLTRNRELYFYYHKLSDKTGPIIGVYDEDNRIVGIE